MPTLYVRNVPDDLHRRVRRRATRKHRSMGTEVIELLEEALKSDDIREQRARVLRDIARSRESLPKSSNSLQLLREDRDR